MTPQLRELLTRIPASPETDELQSLLELMLAEYTADSLRLDAMDKFLVRPCEVQGGPDDGHLGKCWAIAAFSGTLRQAIDSFMLRKI